MLQIKELFLVALLLLSYVSICDLNADPSAVEFQDRAGASFWPTHESGEISEELGASFDLKTCELHYVSKKALDREWVFPCGQDVWPPLGRFYAWLEMPGLMSPFITHGVYAGTDPENPMATLVSVAPAGKVRLDGVWPDSMHLHLLHLDSHQRGHYLQREIFRRVSGKALVDGVQMPEGPIIALAYDTETREYTAVSKPVAIAPFGAHQVLPKPPRDQTDLFVALERPDLVAELAEDDLSLVVHTGDETREPDILIRGVYHLWAVWYGLNGDHARLEVASNRVRLPSQDLRLRVGKLETFKAHLERLPKVSVLFDLPSELTGRERMLEVVARGSSVPAYQAEIEESSQSHEIAALPAKEVEIAMKVPPWTFKEYLDLRSGQDATVLLKAHPITLTGTVFHGEEPTQATISWVTDRKFEELRVQTDEFGQYQAVLFRPVHLVFIELPTLPDARFIEMLDEVYTADASLDFHLPGNRFRVEVIDQGTGTGIAGATVGYFNQGERKTAAQQIETNEEGLAWLPPLRVGDLELDAQAEGYFDGEASKEKVTVNDTERQITIALRRRPVDRQIAFTLSDGRPAGAVEVLARRALDGETLWAGKTDKEGILDLPDDLDSALLLAKHPESAFLIRPWTASSDTDRRERWRLEPTAEPLNLVVKKSWDAPVPFAQIAIRVRDLWIEGHTLAWLTGSGGEADGRGLWRGYHLPVAALEIVALDGQSRHKAKHLLTVHPPWPNPVDLTLTSP